MTHAPGLEEIAQFARLMQEQVDVRLSGGRLLPAFDARMQSAAALDRPGRRDARQLLNAAVSLLVCDQELATRPELLDIGDALREFYPAPGEAFRRAVGEMWTADSSPLQAFVAEAERVLPAGRTTPVQATTRGVHARPVGHPQRLAAIRAAAVFDR